MIKKPSEGTYLGRIIKRAQYFFDSLASNLHLKPFSLHYNFLRLATRLLCIGIINRPNQEKLTTSP